MAQNIRGSDIHYQMYNSILKSVRVIFKKVITVSNTINQISTFCMNECESDRPDQPKDRNTGPTLVTYGQPDDGNSCPNVRNTFIVKPNNAGDISFYNKYKAAYLCKGPSDASDVG